MSDAPPDLDWRSRHALGLPGGSVRALLALGVVGSVCGLLLRDPAAALPEHLEGLLFVVLGHYFAARAQSSTAPADGPPPLWLPRGTVRLLLIGALLGVGVHFFRQGEAAAQRGVVTLVLAGAFILGLLLTRLGRWIRRVLPRRFRVLEDIRALVGLAALAALAAHAFHPVLPGPEVLGLGRLGPEQALAGLVGFYFGSRS